MIRVDILDSSPIFVRGLTQVFADSGIRVVGARTTVDRSAAEVWLADVFMVDPAVVRADLETHVRATSRFGATLLVVDGDHRALPSFGELGVRGVVSRHSSVEAMIDAVRAVAAGRVVGVRAGAEPGDEAAEPAELAEPAAADEPAALSAREEQVLEQIAHGLTHGQIARRLGISRYTVDTYIKRIRAKLGAGNKAELTRVAMLRAFGAHPGHFATGPVAAP